MYQPVLGRFLSRDPLPTNGVEILHPFPDMGTNAYSYVDNRPTRFADPSGTDYRRCVFAFPVIIFPGTALERLVCHYRCWCPDDPADKPVDEAYEAPGSEGNDTANKNWCLGQLQATKCIGDCCKKGGTAPNTDRRCARFRKPE